MRACLVPFVPFSTRRRWLRLTSIPGCAAFDRGDYSAARRMGAAGKEGHARGAVDVTTHEPEKVQDAIVFSRALADPNPSMVALTRTGYGQGSDRRTEHSAAGGGEGWMERSLGFGCVVAALFAPVLLLSSCSQGSEQPLGPLERDRPGPQASAPRYSAPEFLERSDWPVTFHLPSFGIEHLETAVVTELTTGHRQYQTNFLSRSVGGAPACCLAQLWVEEGKSAGPIADLPITRIADNDVGALVKPRREGAPGRIEEPALRYLPFTGSFGGDRWGCFVFLSEVATVLRNGALTPLVYHGYFCQRGAAFPDERSVAAVMQNLQMSSGPSEALVEARQGGFKEPLTALYTMSSVDERIQLCNEYLRSGRLNREEMGMVHGLLGAAHFEKAIPAVQVKQQGLALSDEATRETTAYMMESIQHYTLAIATPPDIFMDNWNRGYAYELVGESEKALRDYAEVIKLEPTFVKGYLYRARVLEQRGERALARTDLKEAVRLEPENPEIAAAMARLSQ